MRLIDTHCHLASAKFAGEADAAIERAFAAGVEAIVTLSTGFHDIAANLALAASHPGRVFAAAGIHPCDVHQDCPPDWQDRLATAARTRGVVAIGESGLDYFHPPPDGWEEAAWRGRQLEFLRGHFEVAATTGLPVVLHTRDRSGHQSLHDALAVARDFRSRVRPMFHCFLGPADFAKPIFDLDGIVSFGGIATFPSARVTLEAAQSAPHGTFTMETDAPYLAPVPHRGKRNEPAFLLHTALHLAAARGEPAEAFGARTSATARQFFSLPTPYSKPI